MLVQQVDQTRYEEMDDIQEPYQINQEITDIQSETPLMDMDGTYYNSDWLQSISIGKGSRNTKHFYISNPISHADYQ